jgi:hypothetical protein
MGQSAPARVALAAGEVASTPSQDQDHSPEDPRIPDPALTEEIAAANGAAARSDPALPAFLPESCESFCGSHGRYWS